MATTDNLGVVLVDPNQTSKTITLNEALNALDDAGNAEFTVIFTGHAATLTAAQFTRNVCFLVSDSAASALTVPLTKRLFVVANSGTHACVVGGASGAAVSVAGGDVAVIYCDATKCIAVAGASGGVPVTPRNTGELMAQWALGAIVANGTFYFSYKAPYAGTIIKLDHVTVTGIFSVQVKINGVTVSGLGSVSVTSTPTTTNATALNIFAAGDTISGVISGATSSPTDAVLNLEVTWS